MQILEDTLRSYRLTHSIPDNQKVDPAVFTAEYFTQEMKAKHLSCPLSGKPYEPFSFAEGAQCPSHMEHTKALKQ